MGFAYKSKTNWHDQYFEKGITIPAISTTTCANPLPVGKTGNSLIACVTAATAVSIPTGKTVTFMPLFSATSDGTFVAPSPAYTVTLTNSSAVTMTFAAGDEVCSFLLPDEEEEYAKIKIATDGACTGALDVALGYTPR